MIFDFLNCLFARRCCTAEFVAFKGMNVTQSDQHTMSSPVLAHATLAASQAASKSNLCKNYPALDEKGRPPRNLSPRSAAPMEKNDSVLKDVFPLFFVVV